MAGGGVGEAMAIGALMGAGTGGVMAAAQDKDPLQGALLGAVTGAATGSLGAGLGSAGTELAKSAGTQAVEQGVTQELSKEALSQGIQSTLAQNAGQTGTSSLLTGAQSAATPGMTPTVGQMMQQSAQAAGSGAGMTPASLLGPGGSSIPGVGATSGSIAGTGGGVAGGTTGGTTGGATSGGIADAAKWMGGGKGEGWATGLTNAQAYGAGLSGGVGGAYSAGQMPGEQSWPTEGEDTSSMSYFKYDPTKYRADQPTPRVYEANYRGMADGGIASLNPMRPMSNSVYPQSQQTQTAFSTSPQYPNSMRSAMASDYDARTNPSLGTEMPMGYARGGIARYGVGGDIAKMQPGGWFGDLHGQTYGAIADATGVDLGGTLGAITPGANQYHAKQQEEEDRKRAEEEGRMREARARQAEIDRNTSMKANMAGGGIASLGGYSDGGRLLRGPGDGVSDSIPASIGGRQPARLADGEFVVPSRIVSELGNGSTDAGARRLYDMMDRVQRRRGTTVGKGKVAKNTKAYQELPA